MPRFSAALLSALLLPAFGHMQAQRDAAPVVPDWALPGSATHKQVPPPPDFHRPSKTLNERIGIFDGQTDVGAALVPGSSSYDSATGQYSVTSAGYNIWYNRDEFRFLWKKMSGDVSLAADGSFKIPTGYDDRKVVLMIRQSLDDDSKAVMIGQHNTGMIHLAQRSETNAQMQDMQFRFGGMLKNTRAKRIGIEKKGDEVTIYVSFDGEPLHQLSPPFKVHFDAPFYVGIGFVSHQPAVTDTGVLANVVLKNSAGEVR